MPFCQVKVRHGVPCPFNFSYSSSLNSPKLSSTGRSVTEKIIAESLLDLFSKLCQFHDGTKKQSRAL